MTATPYPVRTMLRTYGRQVTTARRLARYRRSSSPAQPPEAQEEAQRAREAKRQELVQRVAAEIVENCLVTGSDSPVVEDIKSALEAELGFPLLFAYPPEEQQAMRIFRADGAEPLPIEGEARTVVLRRLWELALEKVDDTML